MCVALIKPKGKPVPNEEILRRCFYGNNDGAGFCFLRDKKIIIKKGFLGYSEFLDQIKKSKIHIDEPAFFHFRSAGKSGVDVRKSQPFPLSNDLNSMRRSQSETQNFVFMHNGTINYGREEYDPYKSYPNSSYINDVSDSMLFGINVFKNMTNPYVERCSVETMISNFLITKDRKLKLQIDEIIKNNRFAFLNNQGSILILGKGWVISNGILYSNDKYLDVRTKVAKKCTFCETKTVNYEDGDDIIYCKECEKKRLKSNSFVCRICRNTFLGENKSKLISDICLDCERDGHFCQCCGTLYDDRTVLKTIGNKKHCPECVELL